MTKNKNAAAGAVVYCGPTILGIAKQYTTFRGGLPTPLREAVRKSEIMNGLLVPLEELPWAMKQLRDKTGPVYACYLAVEEERKRM